MSSRVDAMQRDLDDMLAAREHYIRQYDRSRDGSEEKRNAVEALNRLGGKITRLEKRIEAALETDEGEG